MFVHDLFDNIYYRVIFAFILCIILTFVHDMKAFHNRRVLYITIFMTIMLVWGNLYNDYGLVLLMIALTLLLFNIVRFDEKANKIS